MAPISHRVQDKVTCKAPRLWAHFLPIDPGSLCSSHTGLLTVPWALQAFSPLKVFALDVLFMDCSSSRNPHGCFSLPLFSIGMSPPQWVLLYLPNMALVLGMPYPLYSDFFFFLINSYHHRTYYLMVYYLSHHFLENMSPWGQGLGHFCYYVSWHRVSAQ